ncbi:uncharacterized protein LOC135343202 [Halichondria panicea]|uniref:uncharacterized protein LOC135343202 n=1 Tax=Halichondria panicea TaxID=6063 RepID=UPI00312B4F24
MCLRFLLSAKAFAKFFPPTASQLTSLCEAGISILKPATGRTDIKTDSTPTVEERVLHENEPRPKLKWKKTIHGDGDSKSETEKSLDAFIKEVSDHIGGSWMFIARSLGFTEIEIQAIEYSNGQDLKEQIHQFFYQWKRRDGQEATRDMLYAALYDSELNELLKKLDKTDVKKSDPLPYVYVPLTPPRPHIWQAPKSDTEVFKRRRLDWLGSNLSNNSDSSGYGSAQNILSFSEAPPPSLMPASLQENTVTPTLPRRIPGRSSSVCPFELDDMVMVERRDAAAWCGVVRWIGELPETLGQPVAGIEMEDEVPGGGDGSKDGERYFYCANGHGLFLPVRMLKKDNRFDNIDSSSWNSPPPNQGTPEPQSNAASSESALNDFLSHPFAAGWRSPEEVLKQAGLNISPNVSSDIEANLSEGEERVLVFTVPTDHTGIIIGRNGRNI